MVCTRGKGTPLWLWLLILTERRWRCDHMCWIPYESTFHLFGRMQLHLSDVPGLETWLNKPWFQSAYGVCITYPGTGNGPGAPKGCQSWKHLLKTSLLLVFPFFCPFFFFAYSSSFPLSPLSLLSSFLFLFLPEKWKHVLEK